jgi:predicted nuclease of predicted toxin-antitoxin system
MAALLYADVHVSTALVNALRKLGLNVVRVQDDHRRQDSDESLLGRASSMGQVLLTLDRDFVEIGHHWQEIGRPFFGIVCITSDKHGPQLLADDIWLLLEASPRHEVENSVRYVPLPATS